MKIAGFFKGCLVFVGLSILAAGACYAQATNQGGNQNATQNSGTHKTWAQNHPRRAQVNGRLRNQRRRINQGVKSGKLTSAQAAQLHKDDRQIRHEERRMASQNGGHITKGEQRELNHQENVDSRQIYQEKHSGNNTGSGNSNS